MAITLDKLCRKINIPILTATYEDYPIADGKKWVIESFGGCSKYGLAEIELLYSQDGGATFIHPYDPESDEVRCLQLSGGNPKQFDFRGIEFLGGTDHLIRLNFKNDNGTDIGNMCAWFNGVEKP